MCLFGFLGVSLLGAVSHFLLCFLLCVLLFLFLVLSFSVIVLVLGLVDCAGSPFSIVSCVVSFLFRFFSHVLGCFRFFQFQFLSFRVASYFPFSVRLFPCLFFVFLFFAES